MSICNELTPKQKAFADAFILCGNATEAARRAGYSTKTARIIASENLSKPNVSKYIADRINDLTRQRVADADEIMRFFTAVMRNEERDTFGIEASLSDRMAAGRELLKRHAVVDATTGQNPVTIIIAV